MPSEAQGLNRRRKENLLGEIYQLGPGTFLGLPRPKYPQGIKDAGSGKNNRLAGYVERDRPDREPSIRHQSVLFRYL
jgi:hypothetical protein